MNEKLFNKLFTVTEIQIGPTVLSLNSHGSILGKIYIQPTDKCPLKFDMNFIVISVCESYCTYTWEFYNMLPHIGFTESELDEYFTKMFFERWIQDDVSKNKPDISSIIRRLKYYNEVKNEKKPTFNKIYKIWKGIFETN